MDLKKKAWVEAVGDNGRTPFDDDDDIIGLHCKYLLYIEYNLPV